MVKFIGEYVWGEKTGYWLWVMIVVIACLPVGRL
jgi:hypothetical protein